MKAFLGLQAQKGVNLITREMYLHSIGNIKI
jgi:hypothetical protein